MGEPSPISRFKRSWARVVWGRFIEPPTSSFSATWPIKVLREELAADPERLRRFEQEARSASALNHPNIITIYEIGKVDSTPYIAMELVDGVTLRELLSEGPLAAKKMVLLASQIAEGLAKAHTAGIVHRDLKPENIMVTRDGFVKILDFGLAKLVTPELGAGSNVATMAKGDTSPGMIMGSAGYMSPEQAKGQPADFRADQFAFGVILYEMATGRRAFQGDTPMETLSAIIKEKPDLKADFPANLRAIVERCLAKAPEKRYGSTQDLAIDLKSIGESSTRHRWPRPLAVVSLLAVLLAVILALYVGGFRETEPKAIDSIAVLPLDNLFGDPEQEYFSDGMTEALITELSKVGSLKVISRTSAMRYKDTDKPLPEIARELNVDAVVEGSVLRAGDRVRVTAQLIHAETDQHIWADNYDRDLRDILTLHSEVARTITREIQLSLTPLEETLLTSARQVNPEAHEAYLRGAYYLEKRSPEGFRKAFEYLQQAIEIDPSYAPAYASLAGYYETSAFFVGSDAGAKAKDAALKAIELDENLADGHMALGYLLWGHEWDWVGGEKEHLRAIELNPGYANAHYVYGNYLCAAGRLDEALTEHQKALELDPLSLATQYAMATHSKRARRYDEAIDQLQKVLELEPDFHLALWDLSENYYYKGMYEESLEALKKHVLIWGDQEIVEALEQGYRDSGYPGAMRAAAHRLADRLRETHQFGVLAAFHLRAGEKDQALQWLERASKGPDMLILTVKFNPVWDPLRSDPRFQEILKRMNFPE